MKLFCIVLLAALVFSPVFAADTCKVNDEDINSEYSGGCKGGLANGHGTAKGRDTYTGDFVNGNKQGKGIYVWGSGSQWAGDRYEGDYVNDKRNGKGIYVYTNGDRYEGGWVNSRRTGKGTYTCENGKQFSGTFQNSEPVGFTTQCK